MNPLYCEKCARNASQVSVEGEEPYTGIYHGRDFQEPCPVCRGKGRPAAVIHLAIECKEGEKCHPDLKGSSGTRDGVIPPTKPHRIACGYGPSQPQYLTNYVKGATCYQCLKAYRASQKPVDQSENVS